jgi:hypothetical protein
MAGRIADVHDQPLPGRSHVGGTGSTLTSRVRPARGPLWVVCFRRAAGAVRWPSQRTTPEREPVGPHRTGVHRHPVVRDARKRWRWRARSRRCRVAAPRQCTPSRVESAQSGQRSVKPRRSVRSRIARILRAARSSAASDGMPSACGVTASIDRNPRPSIFNRSTSLTSNTGTSLNAVHAAFRVEIRTAVSRPARHQQRLTPGGPIQLATGGPIYLAITRSSGPIQLTGDSERSIHSATSTDVAAPRSAMPASCSMKPLR